MVGGFASAVGCARAPLPHCSTPNWEDAGQYSTHVFTKRAVEVIEKHNPSQRLFMYLAYQGIHSANNYHLQAPAHLLNRPDIASISPDEDDGACAVSEPNQGEFGARARHDEMRALAPWFFARPSGFDDWS